MKARAAPHTPASAEPAARTPSAAGAARASLSIIALSQDPMLIEALTQAAIGQASVVSSPSADRFADQLVANAAAVALIDAAAAPAPLDGFIASLRQQFPQLLLLLAGPAALQTQFAAQLADGSIFRLAHKPASAQRLKLLVDAALLRRQALIDQATGAPLAGAAASADSTAQAADARSAHSGRRRPLWLLAWGLVVVIVAALGALLWRRPLDNTPADAGITATTGTSTGPSAAIPATTAPAAPAATPAATAPAAAVSQEEAERDAIDRAAAERAERDRLMSESQQREAALAEQVRRTAIGARIDQAHVYVQLARKRLASGALLMPADDSARSYVQSALALAPADAEVQGVAAALDRALRAVAAQAQAQPSNSQAIAPTGAPADTPAAMPAVAPAAVPTPVATDTPTIAAASVAPTVPDVVAEALLQRSHFVPPVYPPEALSRGISGTVELEFTVTPAGDVSDIAIRAAEPAGVFEQAAIAALSHNRYRPVLRDGVAIAQRARIRLRFQP
jgi:TonB family protein